MYKKWERNDIKKYSAETKSIGFRCDASYPGTGNDARKDLIDLFTAILKICPKKELLKLRPQIENVEKILAMTVMEENK